MSKDDGGPAFPVYYHANAQIGLTLGKGMSLRDYFAGQALAGIVSNAIYTDADWTREQIASESYAIADALIAARDEA